MRAGICSVGTELVTGDQVDTNAAWVARRLVEAGAVVDVVVAVPDDHERLVAALRWLVDRCDVVVVGGGLGPTPDDLTREAIAEVAGAPLEERAELLAAVEAVFAGYGRPMSPSNARQAQVPRGAVAFAPVGTAPGFRVDVDRPGRAPAAVYAVPGVPYELQAMVDRDVVPDLLRRSGRQASVTRTVHVTGMGESRVAEAVADVVAAAADDGVEVAFLAGPDDVRVKVTARAGDRAAAEARAAPVVDAVVRTLGRAVAGVDDRALEHEVARLLRLAGLTVATAESCTAGLVSARLAQVPGATDYLRGGVAAYATESKSAVLGVERAVVDEHGPVSDATASAMARRAREVFAADLGLAVTCVAGPTTQGGQPLGTVVWAIAGPGGAVRTRRLQVPGDRATVQARAATALLEGLRRYLAELGADAGAGGAPGVDGRAGAG